MTFDPYRRFPPTRPRPQLRRESRMGKLGFLVVSDDFPTEVPCPVTARGLRVPGPGSRKTPDLLTRLECQTVGRGGLRVRPFRARLLAGALDLKVVAVWPASKARGCHELVTSHNLVDPGRAEGQTSRGQARVVPVPSRAFCFPESRAPFLFLECPGFRK